MVEKIDEIGAFATRGLFGKVDGHDLGKAHVSKTHTHGHETHSFHRTDDSGSNTKLFDSLLDQAKHDSSAGSGLSPQLIQTVLKDVAAGKLTPERALQILDAASQSAKGSTAPSTSQNPSYPSGQSSDLTPIDTQGQAQSPLANAHKAKEPFLLNILQEVATGKLNVDKALQLVEQADQNGPKTGESATS